MGQQSPLWGSGRVGSWESSQPLSRRRGLLGIGDFSPSLSKFGMGG